MAADDLRSLAEKMIAGSRAHKDPDYPRFHLAPPVGRLNDPNGLVVRDGVHHAFYQFSPFHPRKLVYWGHASSPDCTQWTDHGPALCPDAWYDRTGVYSGNALVEDDVTYLFYTGNVRFPDGGRDTHQCLATTTDFTTFTKAPGNPLIPEPPDGYTRHVRDPNVWRDADGSLRMLVGAQRADLTGAALLYRSEDRLAWTFEGELQFPGHEETFSRCGYMWECPALVRVPDERPGVLHDVFLFCPQGHDPYDEGFENVFPACAVVGRLDGNAFHADGPLAEIDRGFEFYAPQVFARAAADPGPTELVAWFGNAGEDDQPSMEFDWVHTFTLVRELRVRAGRLVQRPVLDLAAARPVDLELPPTLSNRDLSLAGLAGSRAFALRLDFDLSDAAGWGLRIGSDASHVDVRVSGDRLVVDRSTTRYPHGDRRTVTLPAGAAASLEVFVDHSTVELFLGDGALAFSLRSFLADHAGGVRLGGEGALGVRSARAHRFD